MPQTAERVPSYKLHKPSGQARVIIRGKHHYLGPYGSAESKERYSRLIGELAANPAAPVVSTTKSEVLVVQLCAAYWDFAQGYYVKDGRPRPLSRHRKSRFVPPTTKMPGGGYGDGCPA